MCHMRRRIHHKRANPSVYVSYEEEDTCVI